MIMLVMMIASAWGLTKPNQHEAFLSTAPAEETMGPNMNFTPVSTTMQCTINLTLQYMVIFTALGLCRTYLDFVGESHAENKVAKALKGASETVFYAPMVCLMFVAFRMRVLQLSKGTDNPQDWVRYAMQFVAYSILANTLLVLLIPMFTKAELKLDEHGDLDPATNPFEDKTMATIFTAIRYITFLGLYVGFGMVCTGVFLYEPPAGVWEGEIPALSPAVACTMTLSTAFFLVYFLHAASRTWTQFTAGESNTDFEETMERAADTMGMAPMLCTLFLAARMRALQMDPVGGNPQGWAQNCFYTATYAITFQTFLAIGVKYLLGGKAKKADAKTVAGDQQYDGVKGDYAPKVLAVCRWIIMICVYVAATAVVCSVFTIEHPNGAEHTPPLSPTMHCVLNLAFQYFFIYLLLWILFTIKDCGYEHEYMTKATDAIESAKATVQFAPMLSVLFIATRMRALQITQNKGAPQGYVQDGMYLASWSIVIQFMMCLIMPFFTKDHKYKADTLAEPVDKKEAEAHGVENQWGGYVVSFIRYCALIALIGGVATVITGVFLMTPENANGRGSIPLITDGTLPVDLAPPPPSVTDIPGAEATLESTGETLGAGVDVANSATDVVASPVANATGAVVDVASNGTEAVADTATEAVAA